MSPFKLLAGLAVAAQLAASPDMERLEQRLLEERQDYLIEMDNLDGNFVDDILEWFYLAGRVDQIEQTLEMMGCDKHANLPFAGMPKRAP